jgi:hypothetical protein
LSSGRVAHLQAHDLQCDRKAEPAAFTGRPGREERLKHLRCRLFIDARPRVAYAHNVRTTLNDTLDPHTAPAFHCPNSVVQYVHEHMIEVARLAFDGGRLLNLILDHNAVKKAGLDEANRRPQPVGWPKRPCAFPIDPRKIHQVARQPFDTARAVHHHCHEVER